MNCVIFLDIFKLLHVASTKAHKSNEGEPIYGWKLEINVVRGL